MSKNRLQEACLLAAKSHEGQWRDGADPVPYLTHPMEVLSNLRCIGGVIDEEILCAAILHDVIEVGTATTPMLEKKFGPRVTELVVGLTRKEPSAEEISGMTDDEIWQLRCDMLLSEIASMPPEVQQIKLADRLSNVHQAFRTKKGRKLKRYVTQTKKILKIIPKSVNPALWNAIRKELDAA